MKLIIIGQLGGYATTAIKIATEKGAKVFQANTLEDAKNVLRQGQSVDLALIDVQCDIKAFTTFLKDERFHVDVVACGINQNPKKAAQAIRDGAYEYIPFPPDAEIIATLLENVTKESSDIIIHDPSMKKILHLVERIAPSAANVLLLGESGTGKEVMAKTIHRLSKRNDKPFVSINCAAIPENLLESELFGHEKGAFTGAAAQRIGKFEEADGGTLLLDEVTEMHPRLQAKLLRAIQEKVIDRVGGSRPIPVNIRIIATSNRCMEEATKKGDFREDLYYRLNVVSIHLPKLSERPLDILPLAEYFLKKYALLNCVSQKPLDALTIDALMNYPWPGNVRELENLMHRAILLSQEVIYPSDVFAHDVNQSVSKPIVKDNLLVNRPLMDVERELILNTLNHCMGNKNTAAKILGISIRTLRNKLKEYEDAI